MIVTIIVVTIIVTIRDITMDSSSSPVYGFVTVSVNDLDI